MTVKEFIEEMSKPENAYLQDAILVIGCSFVERIVASFENEKYYLGFQSSSLEESLIPFSEDE